MHNQNVNNLSPVVSIIKDPKKGRQNHDPQHVKHLDTEKNELFSKNATHSKKLAQNKDALNKKSFPKNKIQEKNKTQKHFKIHHLNCRSAPNKMEEIFQYVEEHDPEILALSETWMDDSVLNRICELPKYTIIRKDRSDKFKDKYGKKGSGGGVAILYKSYLKIEVIHPVEEEIEEILWVRVKGKKSFILGTIYITEYCDMLNDASGETILEKHLREINSNNCDITLIGDFNIDLIENKISAKKKAVKETLKNLMDTYGFFQKIDQPTRIDKNSGRKSLIDHIWTNATNILSWGVNIGISDHFGTFISINKEKEPIKPTKIKIRNFKNYKLENFCTDLENFLAESQIDFHLLNNDANLATVELINVITKTLDIHAPYIEIFPKDKKIYIPWYNAELREKLKRKKEMLKDSMIHGRYLYKNHLKKLTNVINALKKTLKQKYIQEKIEEAGEDPKKIWSLINALTGRNSIDIHEPDNLTQARVDNHNNFFATVGQKVQEKLNIEFETNTKDFNFPPFEFQNVNSETVEKLIDYIKKDVATGFDSISAKVLKDSKSILSPFLTKIINVSYQNQTFPDCLKKAVVKPIYKKDSNDVNVISNYRPISILPVISKIFEKDAANQISKFLEENALLNLYQHAYRKGHSTVTCLFQLINLVYETIEQKSEKIAVITLDLSKAFDSIHHGLLLKKLKNLNLDENSIRYIQSYLSNRKQVTKFSNFISKEEEVKSGVPQGSILGPLLFLCFVNDLPDTFTNICNFLSYADDTQLIVQADSTENLKQKVKETIELAQKWYHKNGLKNNSGKSKVLFFMHDKIEKIKVMDEGMIKEVKTKNSVKILGVHVDKDLSFTKQINILKRNAINVIRQVSRINKFLPLKLKITLYKTLISPIFNYCDIIWGGCSKKDSKKLQCAQNFAIRTIVGKRKFESVRENLKELKLLNLENRRIVHECVFTHKALTEKLPKLICEKYKIFKANPKTRQYSNSKLNIPKHKKSKFRKSPIFRTIISWNKASKNFTFGNIQKHKKEFQDYLLNK